MNKTLTHSIRKIDSSSNQYLSNLPWCESAGVAILNQSTSQGSQGNPAFRSKKKGLAEIFSINCTWSRCHRFPFFSSWLFSTDLCELNTSPFTPQSQSPGSEAPLLFKLDFVIHLLIKYKHSISRRGVWNPVCNPEKKHQNHYALKWRLISLKDRRGWKWCWANKCAEWFSAPILNDYSLSCFAVSLPNTSIRTDSSSTVA